MLANLDEVPPTKDLAGALNNLAQLYGEVGGDAEAEPRFKPALATMESVLGLESVDIAIELPYSVSVNSDMPKPNHC